METCFWALLTLICFPKTWFCSMGKQPAFLPCVYVTTCEKLYLWKLCCKDLLQVCTPQFGCCVCSFLFLSHLPSAALMEAGSKGFDVKRSRRARACMGEQKGAVGAHCEAGRVLEKQLHFQIWEPQKPKMACRQWGRNQEVKNQFKQTVNIELKYLWKKHRAEIIGQEVSFLY